MDSNALLIRQDATAKARERMMQMLLQFEPMREIKLGDVIWIADWVSTITFDAIRDVDDKEERR